MNTESLPIASILLDEARSILPEIVEAAKAVAKVKARYDSLRKFMLERAEASKAVSLHNGFFHDLEALDKEAREAFAIAPMLTFAAGNEWRDMARELGDVPSVGAHPQIVDPITAAARAVGGFRTNSDGAWN